MRAAKGALVGARYSSEGTVGDIPKAQRAAFDAARSADHNTAVRTLQAVVNSENDERTRGWLRMQLAERMHTVDAAEAQKILQAAVKENPGALLPMRGVIYHKLKAHTGQADACLQRVRKCGTPIELMIRVHALLELLQFAPDTASDFEDSLRELGLLIGFGAQGPESEFGSGPDVLWQVGPMDYLLIECKNGVTTEIISKSDVNQLAGSTNWSKEHYGSTANATPVIVHRGAQLGSGATAPDGMRVVCPEKLGALKDTVEALFSGLASGVWPPSRKRVEDGLTFHKLSAAAWVGTFTVAPRKPLAGRRR